jgi:hypothetical protein
MIVIHTARFEVGIHDESAGMPHRHGWFEHNEYGDEFGGGLWFKDDVLVDYDGIGGYLPAEILDVLEGQGFNVDEMRPQP